MGCVSHTVPAAQPSQRAGSRCAGSLLGGCGAAAGLLLPKCPLCWMALAGSFAGASRMQWGAQAAGVAAFVLALGILLRRSLPLRWLLPLLTAVTLLLGASTYLTVALPLRIGLWLVFAAGLIALSRLTPRCACSIPPTDAS